MLALKDWYRKCFKWPILPGEEGKVVKRLELYYGMCEMAKMAIAEYGEKYTEPLISEYALRRAFWWDGEWMGRALSRFVTEREAMCRWGGAKWKFAVRAGADGVYIKPESPLYQVWVKAAHSGGDS
ncbi:PaRep2a protein [Pyrobaculum aerophilum]|uniref:PaREP2a n=1 Tax=Pyrobaculum aerophilum TaxID=13773 RepID=A0A371R6T5_9CREN|nr:PaRep2a protein [Pyrobaculum aerophilum]RFA95839.1 hypothetical protein CGL51_06745 [Pyrobaculum aerophilum]RFB00231.1 hypothetical protein CGL52_01190 [Pyrobaculum aerophilum]